MRSKLITPLLLASLSLAALTGPWSGAGAILDKTRFVLHLGVGFFAFHHWVLRPYQQGKFAAGTPGRVGSMVKGGLALLFAVHELKVSANIAHTSTDPLLHGLDAGITNLEDKFSTAGAALKRGDLSAAGVDSLNSDTSAFGTLAGQHGQPIKDVPTAIPGL